MSVDGGTRLFMISIAAELAGMHPQTLRVYERRGLINPRRSAGRTRLYSEADVATLRRIQELSEEGLNLAGIERVMRLEARLARAEGRIRELERRIERMRDAHRKELQELRRTGTEIVRVVRATTALVPRYAPVITGRFSIGRKG
jgi:MerR family transcriptional regulator, heat shock protein HspR